MFKGFTKTFDYAARSYKDLTISVKNLNTKLLIAELVHELELIEGLIELTPADYTQRGGVTKSHSLLDLIIRKNKVEQEIIKLKKQLL